MQGFISPQSVTKLLKVDTVNQKVGSGQKTSIIPSLSILIILIIYVHVSIGIERGVKPRINFKVLYSLTHIL